MPLDVGEPEIAALMAVGEALVVDAHEVEDGGLQIVDVDGVPRDFVAEVAGLADDAARAHAAGVTLENLQRHMVCGILA